MINKINNIFYPNSYEDVKELSFILRKKHKLIVNHRLLTNENRKKLVDFLAGITFAFEGQTTKISKNKIMFEINIGG